MAVVAGILVAVVAALHAWFLVLEMFLWQRPLGLSTFRTTAEFARATAALAANQGLYNGFLAAGLALTFVAPGQTQFLGRLFLLGCVVVAGLYGAATVSRRILFVQAVPGVIAFVAVIAAGQAS